MWLNTPGRIRVNILVQERKCQLFVSVTDNGSGIPEECLGAQEYA